MADKPKADAWAPASKPKTAQSWEDSNDPTKQPKIDPVRAAFAALLDDLKRLNLPTPDAIKAHEAWKKSEKAE
jgi:hypothetical protein